jgi:hypothetical protein
MANGQQDYLQDYDAAPEDQKYPLVRQWMMTKPLPFFEQLREERPILVTPECTLVSLYSDVTDLLQMPRTFTTALYRPKMGVTATDLGFLMAHDDDALHYREKSLMQGLLNRNDLPRVRKLIEETARKILDDARGSIEIVNDYCRLVPAHLVQKYFGLDGVDPHKLIDWSYWNQHDVFHNQPFDLNPADQFKYIIEKHREVGEQLKCYMGVLMFRKLVAVKIEAFFRIILAPLQLIRRLLCFLLRSTPKPLFLERRRRQADAPIQVRQGRRFPHRARRRQCRRSADRLDRDHVAGCRTGHRVFSRPAEGPAR